MPKRLPVVLVILAGTCLLVGIAHAQYIQGPRGGCYTITKSGKKRYVDRSLCREGEATQPSRSAAKKRTTSRTSGRKSGRKPAN